MPIDNVFASVAVTDLTVAEPWYEALLGQTGSKPMAEVIEWKLPGGGGLQVYALAERAGQCSCTLVVHDIDAEIRKLAGMGVDTTQRSESDRVRTVMVVDPDGNHIALAESRDASLMK
jgi:predicted enzyme related to lactoylglutathione lyase